MKRPIFWQSENFTLDCNTTCTKSNDYRVSQEHDHSYLWIRNVSWEFSNWFFYEGNHKFGHISLDINVKPKIAIKSTSTGYKLMAVCSLPTTVIECYQGKKPLTFTEASQSNCSDGRTFSNIGTLSFSEFCGNVSCQFSTGNIFREYRMWHFESEHSSARNLTTEVVLRFVFFVLLFATGIPVSIGCQMRKEKSLKCEDSLLSICTANTFFWVLTILLFIAWIIVSFSLIIIGNQLETLKVEDRLKGTSTTAIVISRVFLPELILLIMPFTYRCRKCEKGEECLSGFCITAILLFCGSILHIAWVIIRIYLWKQSQTPKREKGKRCRLRTHSLNILSKVVRKNLLASNLRNYRSSEHRTTSGQQ
ncbi:uncharacterized protein LOC106877375 isoform X2 [Octopus bimaculoides]|uniref:uncharacterized protein LOC106877375 isoform X2 n=1 Tax=Octopus bimaculoides TaxID=37653 RepID=UPI0022E634B8|nr:uncharacterized protein LOC106877375 isoform X2 [Octopus bimaculoides]